MNSNIPSKKGFAITGLVLVAMHFMILGSAYLNLGLANAPIVLTLAIIQMIFIILFFMEVRHSAKLIWIFAGAGFFWLFIMFILVAGDYLTRQWH